MIEHAIILAVGDSEHRSQLVYNRPRAMLPALGKPLVVRVMDRLYRTGIRKFTVIVGEDEGDVASYLNTHWVPDADIEYVLKFNNNTLLRVLSQTAGQIGVPFLLTSYNSITHPQFYTSFIKHHEKGHEHDLLLSGAELVLSTVRGRAYAQLDGERVVDLTRNGDEGDLALSTLAACGHHFVDHLVSINDTQASRGHESFSDIVRQYLQTPDARATIAETGWILQINSDADLLTLSRNLLDDGQDAHILSELPPSVRIIPPVRIDPQVSIGQRAQIGPYVYLEHGSSIGHDAVVRHAMVLTRGTVSAGDTVSQTIISSRGPIR